MHKTFIRHMVGHFGNFTWKCNYFYPVTANEKIFGWTYWFWAVVRIMPSFCNNYAITWCHCQNQVYSVTGHSIFRVYLYILEECIFCCLFIITTLGDRFYTKLHSVPLCWNSLQIVFWWALTNNCLLLVYQTHIKRQF